MLRDEQQKAMLATQIGYVMAPRPTPDQLHMERIDGGFVLSGWRNGENVRSVAHNTTRLVALVRAWASVDAAPQEDPGQ